MSYPHITQSNRLPRPLTTWHIALWLSTATPFFFFLFIWTLRLCSMLNDGLRRSYLEKGMYSWYALYRQRSLNYYFIPPYLLPALCPPTISTQQLSSIPQSLPCLLPPAHGRWWSLHPLCLCTYPVYWNCNDVLSYHVLSSGNVRFNWPQSWLLHILPNRWVKLTLLWMPPSLPTRKPMVNMVVEAPQCLQESGGHEPCLRFEEENWLYYHSEENTRCFLHLLYPGPGCATPSSISSTISQDWPPLLSSNHC